MQFIQIYQKQLRACQLKAAKYFDRIFSWDSTQITLGLLRPLN